MREVDRGAGAELVSSRSSDFCKSFANAVALADCWSASFFFETASFLAFLASSVATSESERRFASRMAMNGAPIPIKRNSVLAVATSSA